jgi:hypothetical protein
MAHLVDVDRYPGTLTQLAGEVADLRYDALVVFLRSLAARLESDANADADRGRPRLARRLHATARKMMAAATEVEKAWSICAPRM